MVNIVNYSVSGFSADDIVRFFSLNDSLFIDPFSNHVNISLYVNKLLDKGEVLLAVDKGEICGLAAAYMNDYVEYKAHLQVVLVEEKYQQKGIGRRLVTSILIAAKIKGMKYCELVADVVNTKAIKLYYSLGFVESKQKHINELKRYFIITIGERIKLSVAETQNRLLSMGRTIHNILEKNQIKYMITFGTLLGAVRHKGFIPWDDDFDLFLFDQDYDRAIDILRKEIPSDMFLEDSKSEKNYFHSWAHIKDLNTETICEHFPQDNIYEHKGVSIDLYRAIPMKEYEVDLFRLNENLKYQERKYKVGLITKEEFALQKKVIEEDIEIQKKHLKKNDVDVLAMVMNERMMRAADVFPLKLYPFEDAFFYGPQNYDNILKDFYGDYMVMPKEESRVAHYSSVERVFFYD